MPSVADALRQHAEAYLQQFSQTMPHEHKRVLALITRCRTGQLGNLGYQCDRCPNQHWVGRSCGNRHCPNCQNDKTQVWLAKRMAQLLPVQYFLVTFTVPQSLRMILRANQRACYKALFDCGSQTIVELASGKRFIGSDRLGFFGALHTWGPRLHRLQSARALRCSRRRRFGRRRQVAGQSGELSASRKSRSQNLSRQVPRRDASRWPGGPVQVR